MCVCMHTHSITKITWPEQASHPGHVHQTLAHSSHNCICLLIFLFTIILLKGQLIKRTPVCKRGDSFLLLFTQVFHLSIYTCIYILNPLMDHLFTQSTVDGEVTTTVLLILNQLQLKNCSAGLKERLSPVYQVLTMTRQNHKDRILDIELEKMIPVLPQWKAAPLVHGSTTVAHTGVLYSCHFPSLKAYASYVHWQLRWREGDPC